MQIKDTNEMNIIKRHFYRRKFKKKVRLSRSWYGDLFLFIILLAFGVFSLYPLVFTVANAFKPLDEIFIFPPKLFPENPTTHNFSDLLNLIGNSWVPFSRYLMNTIFITLVGTAGHVIIASMAAYPLAKHRFPGKALIFTIVIYSLMFSAQVTAIPNYIILNWFGFIDTYVAIILPAFAFPLGLYLMKQFMETIPTSLLEAAKIDGANEFVIFWKVVMPLVKPAWLTLIILLFQSLWATNGGSYIYSEQLKPLSYALGQIVNGGIARTGAASAVSVIMLVVPVTVFVLSQSRIINTMSQSGMK